MDAGARTRHPRGVIDNDDAHAEEHGLGAVVARDHDDRPIEVPGPSAEALALVRRASPARLAVRLALLGSLAVSAAVIAFRANAWYEHKQARSAPMTRIEGAGDQRAFEIDRRAVSARHYATCVARRRCTPAPRGDDCNAPELHPDARPVLCVQPDQAAAYCSWVRKRLPTAEETRVARARISIDDGGFRCAR